MFRLKKKIQQRNNTKKMIKYLSSYLMSATANTSPEFLVNIMNYIAENGNDNIIRDAAFYNSCLFDMYINNALHGLSPAADYAFRKAKFVKQSERANHLFTIRRRYARHCKKR